MHLKMNTGLSGPHYCLGPGDEIQFDEAFPFAARELCRHIDAGHCTYVGNPEDLTAWIAANPDPEPEAIDETAVVDPEPEAPATDIPPAPAADEATAAPKTPAKKKAN